MQFNIGYPAKPILNPYLAKSRSSLRSVPIIQLSLSQSTTVSLQCSVQHFKTIGLLRQMLWSKEISRDLLSRWFSGVYPMLHCIPVMGYRKVSNIRRTKSPNLNVLVSSCSCFCPIQWSQVLSRERRCSWSSADRRCSNYIWVIDNFIAY